MEIFNNQNNLLKELEKSSKGRIYTSYNLRIRPEKHPLNPGEVFNARHHGLHYHLKGYSKPNNFGGFDYYRPNGSGARFYKDGQFRGFLEPDL